VSGPLLVRATEAGDRPALTRLVRELWHADVVVAHSTVFAPAGLPGSFAERDGPGAVAEARALTPEIPETGAYGIPLRGEIDLERAL
jgi:hypothetical protein